MTDNTEVWQWRDRDLRTISEVLEWRHQALALIDPYSDRSISSASCCITGYSD